MRSESGSLHSADSRSRRHAHDPFALVHRRDAGPRRSGLRPATRRAPQDREGRRPGHLLPRGRAEGRPDDPAAPRLPDQLADVPQPDPGAGGQVPRRRPGLPRLRPQLDAAARQVRLHLRQPGEGDRRVHREARPDEVRPLRPGLRRPGRLPPGGQAPGADHRHRGAERQRLRRGARQRLLEADQGVLEGAEEQGEARRHPQPAHLRGDQVAVHDTGRRTPSWSARTARPTTSSCSTARATTRSSSTCSSATAATRRSIRSGRRTSASTSRRC